MFDGSEGAEEAYGANSRSIEVELHQRKNVLAKTLFLGYCESSNFMKKR